MRKILMVLSVVLIISLAAVGCGKNDGGAKENGADQSNVVATVNGVDITWEQLNARVDRMEASTGHQGANLTEEQQKRLREGLEKEALNQLITEQLIMQEAKKRGITVDEEKAQEHLDQIKSQFPSEEEFQKGLEQYKLTEQDLIDYFKYQLIEDALFKAVTKDVTVTEQELKDYFEQNKDNLVQMKVRHILIKAREGQATEEEKQQARAKAEELIKELEKGADFAELAKENSDGPTSVNGGLIDQYITAKGSGFVQEFVDAAFQLEEGEFSKEPVKTDYGYHIIKAVEKLDTFEELKDKIEAKLIDQAKNDAFEAFYNELKEKAEITKNL